MKNLKSVENFLDSFGRQVVTDAKGFLQKDKGQTKLANTINFNLKEAGDYFIVEFSMADYGTFVDKGVRGKGGKIPNGKYKGSWGGKRFYRTYKGRKKQSPYKFGTGSGKKGGLTKALDKWIIKKGIAPRDTQGKFMSRKSLKFVMARAIYIRGIHGISFFQRALERGFAKSRFSKGMLKAIKQDIIDNLTQKSLI